VEALFPPQLDTRRFKMNRSLNNIIIAATAFFLSISSAWAGTWTGLTVTNVRAHSTGCMLVTVTPAVVPSGYFLISAANAGKKEMTAFALAAKLTGKTVTITSMSNQSACWGIQYEVNELIID